jgi:hypothetical protein
VSGKCTTDEAGYIRRNMPTRILAANKGKKKEDIADRKEKSL